MSSTTENVAILNSYAPWTPHPQKDWRTFSNFVNEETLLFSDAPFSRQEISVCPYPFGRRLVIRRIEEDGGFELSRKNWLQSAPNVSKLGRPTSWLRRVAQTASRTRDKKTLPPQKRYLTSDWVLGPDSEDVGHTDAIGSPRWNRKDVAISSRTLLSLYHTFTVD